MDPDLLLLRRMRQGDEEAVEIFVRKYYPAILGYCRCHLDRPQEAEDLTQETFARFFASLDRYRHYGKAANYLYAIAGHPCKDYYRKGSSLPLDEQSEPAARPLEALEERLDLEAAFRALPEDIRQTAILYFLQERKQREIAKILDIGLPLVKYRIRRARELLAHHLRKEVF